MKTEFISKSADETEHFAKAFAKKLKRGAVVGLIGELGGGKTSFVRGMALGLKVKDIRLVRSPTFTILNEYHGITDLYHFDLYRLKSVDELIDIGFDEYIYSDGISVIEWADRFENFLPKGTIYVNFEVLGEDERRIVVG